MYIQRMGVSITGPLSSVHPNGPRSSHGSMVILYTSHLPTFTILNFFSSFPPDFFPDHRRLVRCRRLVGPRRYWRQSRWVVVARSFHPRQLLILYSQTINHWVNSS